MKSIDDKWIAYFRNHGYPKAKGIAAGMEGAVYLLVPGELVAKVWLTTRSEPQLRQLQKFYERLASASNPLHTPELIELEVVGDTLISKERFLPGRPLQDRLIEDAHHADEGAINAIIEVLKFLQSVTTLTEGKLLSVLDDATPFWFNATSWSEAVQALISRLSHFQLKFAIPVLVRI